MRLPLFLFLPLAIACGGGASDVTDATDLTDDTDGASSSRVRIETTLGDIVVQLATDEAPVTTENFLAYVDSGFYDGSDGAGAVIFHRVIEGFMIQGGGVRADGTLKTANAPIALEVDTGLKNDRGTISMARMTAPDTATSQFFINHVDNPGLDSTGPGTGYAVFGEVVSGMDVVDAIAEVDVDNPGGPSPRPLTDVVIEGCARE